MTINTAKRMLAAFLFTLALFMMRSERVSQMPPIHQHQTMEAFTIDPVSSARRQLEQLAKEREQYVSQRLLRGRGIVTVGDQRPTQLHPTTVGSGATEARSEPDSRGGLAATNFDS